MMVEVNIDGVGRLTKVADAVEKPVVNEEKVAESKKAKKTAPKKTAKK